MVVTMFQAFVTASHPSNYSRSRQKEEPGTPYDAVMADRGLTIAEDLLLHRADLFIPPGKRGQDQFMKAGVQKTKTIANVRIFVEQAIRQLKTFRIIKNKASLPVTRYFWLNI